MDRLNYLFENQQKINFFPFQLKFFILIQKMQENNKTFLLQLFVGFQVNYDES